MKLKFLYPLLCLLRGIKQKRAIIKLTTVFVFICALHLSAATFAQNVTIKRHNASLETIFKDIKKQTGYMFFYPEKISLKQTLDIDIDNAPLETALATCLKGLDLNYTIINKTVVISRKAPEKRVPGAATGSFAVPVIIQGKVIDSAANIPLIGVNISVKNKAQYTQTNASGEFTLSVLQGDVLSFSYVGYQTKEVTIKNGQYLKINMLSKNSTISDVVITGYQVIKKDNYTGSAIVIKGDDLQRVNPQNLIKSIATFDPSLRIADNNLLGSDPNALPKITVRGSTTLPSVNGEIIDRNNLSSTYNLPVFLLDGFEVSLEKVVDLDMNRISSVTILKDAAATAVYGSRAANGVIVITTKAPIPGKLQLSYNYQLTVQAPDLTGYHVLNAADKLQYEKLAGLYSAVNNTASSQDQLDNEYYSKLRNVVSGINTYWLSQPLINSYGHKHSLYAEGGDSTFRYGINLRYQTNPGVMKGSSRNQYTGGMSFFYNPSRNVLIKNEVTVSQVNSVVSKYGDFSTYVSMNPYYPIKDANGNYIREIANWVVDTHYNDPVYGQYRNEPVYNPLFEASLGNFNKSAYLELLDDISIDWKIFKGLRLIGLMSVTDTKGTSDAFVSPLSNSFFYGPTADIQNRGSYDYVVNNSLKLDGNLRFVYNTQLGNHSVNATLGSNITSATSSYKAFEARGFSNDKFTNIGFARTYTPNAAPAGDEAASRLIGSFFSGSYSFKNKYLLDATFRLDGSSAFGSNQRFAPFWATGIGWNMHYEDFIKNNFPSISRLKITASTGITGSVDFPPSLSNTTYTYQTSNWYSTGVGATVNGYGNSDLKWQKTNNFDLSLELGLFKDRIVLNPHYYYKLTKGLLSDINIAPSTGYSTYKANLGDMGNRGYELYLTANAFRSKDLNINIVGNLSHNTNKIVSISNALKAYNKSVDDYQSNASNGVQGTPLLRFAEGQSINTIWGVKSLGIDLENGKEILVKKDGSLTYNYDIADTQPIGDSEPKVEGYIGSNITYKQFLLSFTFHYKFGGQQFNQTLIDRVENADPRFNVDSRALAQRWQKPGDVALYKNIADLGTSYATSRFIQKENTIDLPSFNLSYDVKKSIAKKIGMQMVRATLTVNDVFHSSSIETERGITYPYARSLTCSIQATF
ncbi:SusC/RagA family TonB-linked outer membrane protein [Mucilaginibacter sp. KACC 22773]|uniref:SusC/RagA family TonB-linked outer membrane protein n=1 Tax=Mucilaginibacter sp. KACC 22773 TaxID=3025671 RepID=UPI00236500C3|nr:SusC/RagA family TonB-linked outer membrane protein [Mucilaginibacter sp. KACC 22773]WDF80682.1 SusC/RagA family TonB-linked outer membrane protein [Mucilaginibacter sp. KACC 22773]